MLRILQKQLISRLHFSSYAALLSDFPCIQHKMSDRAIVKYKENEEYFTFSFYLKISDLKIDKQFNLNRNINEETIAFLERLNNNISKAKKKNVDYGDGERLKAQFIINDTNLIDNCGNATYPKIKDLLFLDNLKLKVDNIVFNISINPPLITDLKVSDVIMIGMPIYPHKISLEYANDAQTNIEWFRSQKLEKDVDVTKLNKKAKTDFEDALKWERIGEGLLYTPDVADLQCRLKCQVTPWKGVQSGEPLAKISSSVITLGPGVCPTHSRHAWTGSPLLGPKQFRLVTYNILADLYADSDYSRTVLFAQCPPYALHIDYRVKLVLQELIGYNADLICLQEVDQKVFECHLTPVLKNYNLEGRFARKGGQVAEGLAIFCRCDKLTIIDFTSIFLPAALLTERYKYIWDRVSGNEELVTTLTQRTTTLAVAVVQVAATEDILIVGNTHLYFKPDVDHIRLIQIEICIKELERVRSEVQETHPNKKVSVVLCGDFNSTPFYDGHMGGVLQYLTQGRIEENHPDWKSRPSEEVEGLCLSTETTFMSAAGTPQFTNYALGFKDCLDYIFIEEGKAKVDQV